MSNEDCYNSHIHNISLQLGQLFSDMHYDTNDERCQDVLEAYINLRRLLPVTGEGKHIGHHAGYQATQGDLNALEAR